MNPFKVIAFDLGGVIFDQSHANAIRHFGEVGVREAATYLNPFFQEGIFGDLEDGKISAEDFRRELSKLCGKELSLEDCRYGWSGFRVGLPQYKLDFLRRLRTAGHRLVLLSNTNPFMLMDPDGRGFDGQGNRLEDCFDALYLSYECKLRKPDPAIYEYVLTREGVRPEEMLYIDDSPRNARAAEALGIVTLNPEANTDWTGDLLRLLGETSGPASKG